MPANLVFIAVHFVISKCTLSSTHLWGILTKNLLSVYQQPPSLVGSITFLYAHLIDLISKSLNSRDGLQDHNDARLQKSISSLRITAPQRFGQSGLSVNIDLPIVNGLIPTFFIPGFLSIAITKIIPK